MKAPRRDPVQARQLRLERQRYYDAFKLLRTGETLVEFPFTAYGERLVAKDVRPFTGAEVGTAFYYVAWFVCFFGRGAEGGPRVCMLDFKGTGNPRPYGNAGFGNYLGRGRITCPREHIFGLVWGGIWREDGTCDPNGPPLVEKDGPA